MTKFIHRYILAIPVFILVVSAVILAVTTFDSTVIDNTIIWIVLKGLVLFFIIDAWLLLYIVRSNLSYLAIVVFIFTVFALIVPENTAVYGWVTSIAMFLIAVRIKNNKIQEYRDFLEGYVNE